MRILPQLTGITHDVLQVLGTVYLKVQVGTREVTHLFLVVPDKYLDTDVLLGADLLNYAPLTWDALQQVVVWDGYTYPVKVLKPRPANRRVRHLKLETPSILHDVHIRLKTKLVLPRYSAGVYPVPVEEEPNTLIEFLSQGRESLVGKALCLQVSESQQIFLPLVNNTKVPVTLKTGTLLGSYRKVNPDEIESYSPQCRKTKIVNDLVLPEVELDETQDLTREDKLEKLLSRQDYSHLSADQQRQLQEMLLLNQQAFILESSELGKIKDVQAHIEVSDPTPVRSPMYRYPERAKETISKMLEEMEEKDIIEPSTATWLSPIVLVKKPDHTHRMCLDYRKVNKHLQVDIHPLPRLEEMVENAAGNCYYASLDLKEAYYQVELDPKSRDVTTFSDGVALYRFKRLPFGLSCSPAVFSRVMMNVLAPLIKLGWVKNYLDDVIVWAPSFSTLLQRLHQAFSIFIEKGIKLNVAKCNFGQKEIKFLGHLISEEGCKPCPENISAIHQMKPPSNVKEVRRFLGMCGFYRKHVENYAKISVPMTNLLRGKEKFQWTPECQSSFEQLKAALTTAPVLVKAQVNQPFELHTDASQDHVGAVLMQRHGGSLKPIGYFSKKLKPVEQRYSTTDREALGIILACRRFHHFLWGVTFTIHTDHQPLVSVFRRKTKSPRMSRWVVEMQDYRFRVEYNPGKTNHVADQLSRPVRPICYRQEETYLGLTKEEFQAKQLEEPRWSELIHYLEGGPLPRKKFPRALINQFILHEGLLYLSADKLDNSIQLKLVVPQELRKAALSVGHDKTSGHLGRRKTIDCLETTFYWPSLRTDVHKFVTECVTCQRHKDGLALQQPYQELPPVTRPLDRISLDLTDMLSGANGYRYVLTILDHYSRYVKFFPLRTKQSEEVAKQLRTYLHDFGVPVSMITDNGGEFTSQQFRDLCHAHNISLGYTTPYHPQGNSLSERMHRTLKTVLNVLCKGHPHQWPKYLGETQRVLNTAVHTTLGETPHYAFFSRRAPRQIAALLPSFEDDVTQEAIEKAHQVIRETHLLMARKYRQLANRHRKQQAVEEGDLVWVRREHYLPGTSHKLQPKWAGPFKVKKKIRNGAKYELENLFTQQMLERSADKIKPFRGKEEWLTDMLEVPEPELEMNGTLRRGGRDIQPPARLIEEI